MTQLTSKLINVYWFLMSNHDSKSDWQEPGLTHVNSYFRSELGHDLTSQIWFMAELGCYTFAFFIV